jgi:cytochrome P450
MHHPLQFEPLSEDFLARPYAILNHMRESCRAYRHADSLCRVVSVFRNEDVRAIANNWHDWSSDRGEEFRKGNLGDATVMFYDDPPEHTKLRAIVAPLFLPARVHALTSQIEQRCTELLDDCLAARDIDVIDDFASKLTIYMISKLIGLPESALPRIRRLTEKLEEFDGQAVFWRERRPAVEAQIGEACREMGEYFADFIRERRRRRQDDVLSTMLEGGFTDAQASGFCQLLVIAGQATTTNLIGNAIHLLMTNPQQHALLRQTPGLLEPMVEESLRLRSQLRKLERIANTDCAIDGVEIRKGDFVALWLASANRDPRVFDRPDEFDITRGQLRHASFGTGVHMCIGNALARLEARIALRQLLARTRTLEYPQGPEAVHFARQPIMDIVEHQPLRLIAA